MLRVASCHFAGVKSDLEKLTDLVENACGLGYDQEQW